MTPPTSGEASSARSAALPMSPVGPVTATVRSEAAAPATISAGGDRVGGPAGQRHDRRASGSSPRRSGRRWRRRSRRRRVVELAPGSATEVCGSAPIRQVPIWWAEKSTKSRSADREVADRGDERLEVVAAPPVRCVAAQRADLLGARRLVDPRPAARRPARVRDVELVGDRVVGDRRCRRRRSHPAVAALAGQADKRRRAWYCASPPCGRGPTATAARPRSGRWWAGRTRSGSRGRRRGRRTRARARLRRAPPGVLRLVVEGEDGAVGCRRR